jgi:hypothetical protein
MLAGILGIHPTTAVKWTKLAGGDWTGYVGGRSLAIDIQGTGPTQRISGAA